MKNHSKITVLETYTFDNENAGKLIPYKPGPFVIASDKILYVDVDDTLIVWDNGHSTYKPHTKHINLIKRFHKRGQAVVVWSAGGYEWAERIVKELELEQYVSAIMCKPVWWMDDLTAPEVLLESGRIYFKQDEESKKDEK